MFCPIPPPFIKLKFWCLDSLWMVGLLVFPPSPFLFWTAALPSTTDLTSCLTSPCPPRWSKAFPNNRIMLLWWFPLLIWVTFKGKNSISHFSQTWLNKVTPGGSIICKCMGQKMVTKVFFSILGPDPDTFFFTWPIKGPNPHQTNTDPDHCFIR